MASGDRVYEMGRRKLAPQELTTKSEDSGNPYSSHPLDSDKAREIHKKLLNWYLNERQVQAANRMEMALDADFYDNIQWDADDAEEVRSRGQMPLVYNEVAEPVDWLIGTERRARADWKVLPRTDDDVELADVKTKALKYVSDVNGAAFERSLAFADAVKSGVGWIDDGARDDPTQEILYSQREDWRVVLWDSIGSRRLDVQDGRYIFRWRWVDEDVALAMFPERSAQVRRALEDGVDYTQDDTQEWNLGDQSGSGTGIPMGSSVTVESGRRRIRLIEAQFRLPSKEQVVDDGPMRGLIVHPLDSQLGRMVQEQGYGVVEKLVMRTHIAVMTETDLLSLSPSPYRHNRFTLTPIWCYRRGRDRMPYGVIRRVRDIQRDLNKRASKALFYLSTNQVIADKGAVDNVQEARDEVDRPDGWVTKNAGKEFTIRRDSEAANGQVEVMAMQADRIRQIVGVNSENLGRQTNAISGAAIQARQSQGSIATTEPFDNLRMATQWSGEKQLSLIEQFYSEPKVIRLSGARGKLEWVKINQPEQQADGSWRYLNDITASKADFVVAEADYSGTLRQVMFDSINALATKLPPEMGMRLFLIAMEFSDLPNKMEITDSIRRMVGEPDPNGKVTPEEEQKQAEAQQQQQEAMALQREQAMLALEEQRAKVAKMQAEVEQLSAGQGAGIMTEATMQLENTASQLKDALAQANQEISALRAGNDTKLEIARIDADTKLKIAEISSEAEARFKEIEGMIASASEAKPADPGIDRALGDLSRQISELRAEPVQPAAPAEPPVVNITVPVTIERASGGKSVTLKPAEGGGYTAAVTEATE